MNEQQKWERRYWRARTEHAYRMRVDGLTHRRIGERLGVGPQRVAMLLFQFERHQREEALARDGEFSDWRPDLKPEHRGLSWWVLHKRKYEEEWKAKWDRLNS